jgi:hypothetical protein
MRLLLLVVTLCKFSNLFSQENIGLDKRNILFYVFDSTSTKNEIVAKTLGRISDTSLISGVKLIVEKNNGNSDTLKCDYSNNTISFRKIDTSKNDIVKISLSLKLNFSIYKKHFDEVLTFPYKYIIEQTNANSDISISLVRQRNNLFRISISKLDYPFIVSSSYLPSEIIGLYK